jgi:hypothetical protein
MTRLNLAFYQRGLFPDAYKQIASKIVSLGFDWTPETTAWCLSPNATTPDIVDLDWHSMPFVEDYFLKAGEGFRPSNENGFPSPDFSADTFAVSNFANVDVFFVTFHGGDVDMGCLRIRDYFAIAGYTPDKVIAVSGGKTTSSSLVLDWSEVVARAEAVSLSVRFRYLYDLNFRGLLLNAIRHGIRCFPDSTTAFLNEADRRERLLSRMVFEPELLQALYLLRDVGPVPYSPAVSATLSMWQAIVDGGLKWLRNAEECESLRFGPEIWSSEVKPLTIWTGTGRIPCLSDGAGSLPFARIARALSTAEMLDFVEHDDRSLHLSRFGLWFLDLLPSKAKDVDAPIRWSDIGEHNKRNADNWLLDHFGRIKRAVNKWQFNTATAA